MKKWLKYYDKFGLIILSIITIASIMAIWYLLNFLKAIIYWK